MFLSDENFRKTLEKLQNPQTTHFTLANVSLRPAQFNEFIAAIKASRIISLYLNCVNFFCGEGSGPTPETALEELNIQIFKITFAERAPSNHGSKHLEEIQQYVILRAFTRNPHIHSMVIESAEISIDDARLLRDSPTLAKLVFMNCTFLEPLMNTMEHGEFGGKLTTVYAFAKSVALVSINFGTAKLTRLDIRRLATNQRLLDVKIDRELNSHIDFTALDHQLQTNRYNADLNLQWARQGEINKVTNALQFKVVSPYAFDAETEDTIPHMLRMAKLVTIPEDLRALLPDNLRLMCNKTGQNTVAFFMPAASEKTSQAASMPPQRPASTAALPVTASATAQQAAASTSALSMRSSSLYGFTSRQTKTKTAAEQQQAWASLSEILNTYIILIANSITKSFLNSREIHEGIVCGNVSAIARITSLAIRNVQKTIQFEYNHSRQTERTPYIPPRFLDLCKSPLENKIEKVQTEILATMTRHPEKVRSGMVDMSIECVKQLATVSEVFNLLLQSPLKMSSLRSVDDCLHALKLHAALTGHNDVAAGNHVSISLPDPTIKKDEVIITILIMIQIKIALYSFFISLDEQIKRFEQEATSSKLYEVSRTILFRLGAMRDLVKDELTSSTNENQNIVTLMTKLTVVIGKLEAISPSEDSVKLIELALQQLFAIGEFSGVVINALNDLCHKLKNAAPLPVEISLTNAMIIVIHFMDENELVLRTALCQRLIETKTKVINRLSSASAASSATDNQEVERQPGDKYPVEQLATLPISAARRSKTSSVDATGEPTSAAAGPASIARTLNPFYHKATSVGSEISRVSNVSSSTPSL